MRLTRGTKTRQTGVIFLFILLHEDEVHKVLWRESAVVVGLYGYYSSLSLILA